MDVRDLLERVRGGEVSPEDAAVMLKAEPFVELGYAKPDTQRRIRQGSTEAVYGAGKTPEQASGIVRALLDGGAGCVLVTRCPEGMEERLESDFGKVSFNPAARSCLVGTPPTPSPNSLVAVVTAGTSDVPVAEEAVATLEAEGSRAARVYDVGVSGIHRLLASAEPLMKARAVVVAAGMEGALPSVVGGLVGAPVVAVPTSVGYGASFGGLTALLSMLNSCSSNVSVVNIDNGFGAGHVAGMIDRRTEPL